MLALSEQVQLAIIPALAAAVPILLAMWFKHRLDKAALESVKADVKKIETNTNSMREQMVNSAHDAGHRAGVADQKADAGNGLAKDVLVAVAEIKGHAAGVAEQKAADAKPIL